MLGRHRRVEEHSEHLDFPYLFGPMNSASEAPPSPYGPSNQALGRSHPPEEGTSDDMPSIHGPLASRKEAPPSPFEGGSRS
jgi:hypothetical protein